MKKNLLKVMSLVLALMLIFSTTAFAAYTLDELSGANAPVKIVDGVDPDPDAGVNLIEGLTALTLPTLIAGTECTYDAATDTYKNTLITSWKNLFGYKDSSGLNMTAGNKYVVSFDVTLPTSNDKDITFRAVRATGSGVESWTGRNINYVDIILPANTAANSAKHVEIVLDYTAVDTLPGDGLAVCVTDKVASNVTTVDISNFKIEKYGAHADANLLSVPYNSKSQVEYTVTCDEDWESLIGWKDGEGLSMVAGKKYKFTADIELSSALANGRVVKITRATAGWSNRNNTYGATYTIPAGSSGVCRVEIILDFTDIADITNGGTYNGLLFVTNQNFAQDVKVSNCKLVLADEYAVYHTVGENILVDAPVTVNHTKYTGDAMPKSVTCKNDSGYNAYAWEYSDTFKFIQGKTYRISFDWSVPSTTDTETKTITWCLSNASTQNYADWTGRGDPNYICNNNLIAHIKPDVLSGTITKDFVFNISALNDGITLWRGGTTSSATEYTISNVKIVPVLQEIDVQTDGDEIVVIQNEETANAFNDLIILAEYEGDVLKTFDFTTPDAIAEKNEEGTIALRAKLSGVGENSTVKMFRWRDFSSLDPINAPVEVK